MYDYLRDNVSEKKWVVIEQTASYVEAILIREILSSIGCPCIIQAQMSYHVFPFNFDPGFYQILVPPDWEEEASEALDEYRKGGTPVQMADRLPPVESPENGS